MEKKVRLNVGNESVGRQKQGRQRMPGSLIGAWLRAALRQTAARSWGGLVVLLVLLGSSQAALAGNTITPSIGANNTSPLPGSTLTLTLGYVNTYTNGTNRTATIVRTGTITGLPTGLTGVTFAGLGAAGATYNTGSGTITFNTGANGYDNTLAANDNTPDLDFAISFTVPAGMGAFTATSAPTTNTQSTTVNPQSVSVTVAPQLPADVSVTVSAPATAPAGAQATITVTATNTSTTNTATDVVVTAQLATGLPAGAVNVSNDGTYNATTGAVTFPAQALGPNGTFTPTIRLLMPASGTRTVKVSATSAVDLNAANNNGTAANANATITVTQVADVAISVSGPTAATPGSAIVYSVLLTNQGPSTATGLTAQLVLGGAPTNVVITGGGTLAGSTVSFTVPGGSLASGSSLIYTVRLTVPATGPVTGTASATSTTANGDPVAANNNGTAPASQVSTAVVASTPSEVCATPGTSGSLTYSGTQGINTYYPGLTGTGVQNQAGQKVLAIGVATTSGTTPVSGALAVGDLVLVMQMQGAPINTTNTSSYGDGYAGDPGSGSLGGTTFTAGQYEYGTVAALAAGTVTLTNNLVNTYQNANATATTGQRRFQVIRVPQYQDFTLTANLTTVPAWNGSTGGVLALDVAGTLNLGTNRVINLVGKGFRGGGGRQLGGAGGLGYANTDYRTPATANVNAAKGEGIAGTPRYLNNGGTTVTDLGATFGYPDGSTVGGGDNGRGAPGNAGGGGTDTAPNSNEENTGGGGGSNGGTGGQGGNGWRSNLPSGGFGGAPFLAAAPSRLVLGGGGGAGTTNNGTVADDDTYPGNAGLTNDGFASSGAAGGGMLLARVGSVSGTGTINVSGADMTFVPENDGSGGGGGGGSALLLSNNTAANALTGVTVLATGGQGGSNTGGGSAHGPGGGGSGGVVFASSPLNAASSYGAGTNGTTFNGIVYEAGPGTSSPAFVRNSVGFDETPLLQSGANCVADLTTTLSGPTALATGGNAGPYTVTFTNNGPGSGSFATRTVTLPTGASLSSQQLLDIQAQVPGATYTSGTRVISFGAASGTASGATSSYVFSFTAPATTGTGLTLSSAVTAATGTNQGANQAADNASLTLSVSNALTGIIFEDVNYGGGAGRNYTTANAGSGLTSGAIRRPGVRVELYNTSTGAFVAAAITDASGQYALPVQASTGYTLRVVNNTVTSARPGATFSGSASTGYLSTQLAVQTFNGLTDRVGGEYPGRADADANTTGANLSTLTAGSVAAQSLRTLTSAASGLTTGPDFGFNFNVVTNTNDAGQGSLRQFILNANALGGETTLAQSGSSAAGALAAQRETSIFMIPNGGTTAANNVPAGLRSYSASTNAGLASQLSGGVAVITPATALPAISGPNTFIDGSTQTSNIGNTNNVTLGAGGTVGTAATALGTVNGPEVQLSGTAAVATGLDIAGTGTGTGVLGLAIYGFGTNGDNDNSAGIRAATGGLTISRNVLGSPATGFADPGTSTRGLGDGIRLTGGTTASSISNNLIGFHGGKGIAIGAGVTTVSVTNNEVRSNAQNGPAWDGIDVQGSAATVTGNLFVNNAGVGIDSYNSAGANTITGNTVSGNGRGTATLAPDETPGIRLFGALNVVSQNVSTGNYGAGVMVVNSSPTTTISQNSIYNNGTVAALNGAAATGQLGIDLTNGSLSAGDAPFLTLNDNGDTDGGANGLLNFPVITSATVVGANLVVQGFARPGARIEFFNPGPVADPSGFGEGQTYLGTVTEGGAAGGGNLVADTNADTGNYGPGTINGLSQGADNTNRFTFSIPLTGAFAGYAAGSLLTATATLDGATSEFAGNVAVNTAPVANTLTNTAGIPNTSAPVALAPGLSGTANGSGNSIAAYTIVSLPASGTLSYVSGSTTTPVAAGTTITAAQLASLRYTPASGTTGNVSFSYTVTDANGIASLSNSSGGTITAGPATYTIPVTAVADVATTITPSATPVNAGAALSFSVTYTNAGPNPAAGYAQTLTLSSGLGAGNVTFANLPTGVTASYNTANGQVTFTGTPTTLASGTNQNLTVTIAVVPAGLSSITASSTVTTSTGQGADTGANSASVTVPVTPVADVTTTLSGPTQIIPGSTNTYAVNFLNNGPSPAAGVTRTVSIPAGSSNVTAAGGTIGGNTASGFTITYTPNPTTLASGSPTPYSFSFTAPTAIGTSYALTSTVGTSTSQGADAAPNSATLSLTTAGAGLACNSVFYRVREVSGNSLLERLDRSSAGGTITYAGTTLYSTGVSLNALAFNYADGYLYAFRTNSNVLYRLSSTGAQEVGAIAGIPATGANAATSDLNGLMYIADNSTTTLYRLNLSTLTLSSNVTLSAAVNFGDMAYNPVDNNIYANRYYATSGANGVARINPTSGAVTVLGTPATSGDDVGSLFFDAAGGLYAATNQGNFVGFNTGTGASTLIGAAGSAAQSDGASCVFPTEELDVVLSAGTPVRVSSTAFDVTYTVRVKNTGAVSDANVQVNNFLNDGTNPTGAAFPGASSVTVTTAPAIASGPALALNSGFNGTTSPGLLAGTTALASNATSVITYTVRVTYPSVAAIPTTAQNNSVYASTTGTSPNAGYVLVNGTALAPTGVLAGDQSTTGSTLPATPGADTPSPTPVTFANPLVQNITNVALNNTAPATVLSPNLSATPGLNGTGAAISSFTISALTGSGTLRYNGTPVTGPLTVLVANVGLLTYQPVPGNVSSPSFTFFATDANGGVSNTATYTIPVQSLADVTTTLNGPAQLSTGTAASPYTVTYANVGLAAAGTVTRTLTLPAGATNIVAPNGTITGTSIDFGNVPSLAAGGSASFTFSFTAPTTAGGVAIVSTTTTTSNEGTNPAPNSSTISATVTAVADVAATISSIAGTVAAGSTGAGFNVNFANNGALTAAGVTRTVQLPAGLGAVSATNGGSYDNATGLVTYAPAPTTIANGAPLTSTITFVAPASGPVAATASVSTTSFEAGQTANNTQSATLSITPGFNLITTIDGPDTTVQGNPVTLYVTTANNGPSAAPNAQQTVQLIGGLANVFVSNGGIYNATSGLVTFPALPSLPSGQAVANTISFTAPAVGTTLAPAATVTPNTTPAGEIAPANNLAYLNGAATSTSITITAPTTPQANAYATISGAPATVAAGGTLNLTVTASNAGPAPANSLSARVQLPAGLGSATFTLDGATGTFDGGTNTITFAGGAIYSLTTGLLTLPTVATQVAGTAQSYALAFPAPAGPGNDGQLLLTAAVSTATSETVLSDNLAASTVRVLPTTDLATTISGPASAGAGQPVTYTATFANNGPGLALGVARMVQLPAGLSAVTVTDVATGLSAGTYNSTTGLLTLPTLTSLPAGSSAAYTIGFAAPAVSFAPRSAVSATTTDGVAVNNRAATSTTVAALADVAVALSGPATAVVGNPVTYYATTTNNGPSAATGVATTLQLPANLSGVTVSNGGSYVSSSGLVTFTAIGPLASGASVADYVTFTMPSAAGGQLNGVATANSTSTDPVAANNTVSTATSVAPVTSNLADVATTVSLPASTTAGSSTTATVTFTNNGPAAAANVAPTLQLPASLTALTVSNAGSYNAATGVVTWPLIASQASGNTATYTVAFAAPASGPLRASSAVSSQTSDGNLTNNSFTTTATVTASYDVTTSLGGPASSLPGATNAYTVTTTNNGPSVAGSVTPTVTLPAGVTASNISGGGSQTGAVITWPAITNLAAGPASAVAYTFDVPMPASGNLLLNAAVTGTGEPAANTGNNTASTTTARSNRPPVAANVVNARQSPQGNTATTALSLSSLAATDADGSIAGYQLTGSLPPASQGVLYYNNNADGVSGSYVTLPIGQPLSPAQAGTLRFDPTDGYAGNVFFTYTATDNLTAGSNAALYTLAVGQDNASRYTATPSKGGPDKYVTNDVLAFVIDPNGARYNSAGLIFDQATGAMQAGVTNGLASTGTNAQLTPVGTAPGQTPAPAGNPTNTLPPGTALNPSTGQIYVSTASLLPRITTATTYTVNITTTDVYGGVTTQPVSFTLGAFPLPVELTTFTAQAVRNVDGLLKWTTASEKNNDHFDVERSLDGRSFEKIGQVKGQGSKASPTDYALTDANAARLGRQLYYRLRQVDADGTSSYSPVRTISFTTLLEPNISLWPNPMAGTTNLDLSQLPAGSYEVWVLDATGRVILGSQLVAGQSHLLNIAAVANGTYTVRVRGTEPGNSHVGLTKRLIKN